MSFKHISYTEYVIGASYEYKDWSKTISRQKEVIEDLGVLVAKKLCGRPYDQDVILTFQKPDGTTYEHVMEFGDNYRKKWDDRVVRMWPPSFFWRSYVAINLKKLSRRRTLFC